jgi:cell wall-associated NlpC family hydrolase
MLSLVSVVSVNLITSLSITPTDSARLLAATSNVAETNASTISAADDRVVDARKVLASASRYLGTRYQLGGTNPSAFDCSGFVRYVFARQGVALPRTASDQSSMGHPVVMGVDSLEVGDLLFFRTNRGRAAHVAIYAGNGRIIHASAGSRRVRYDDLASPRGRWFIDHLSSARRIIGNQESGIAK